MFTTKIFRITAVRLAMSLPCLIAAGQALGHGENAPPSLQLAEIPPVPGLLEKDDSLGVPTPIVVDKEKAIVLGKALFWDMQVGSDGVACGTCHFAAGADHRIKNQIYPSKDNRFDPTASGGKGGPNYTLTRSDFPTTQFNNPADKSSGIKFQTDDVVGSQGVFKGKFEKMAMKGRRVHESCDRSEPDPVHQVSGVNTRRLEPRNTPTMINAVFNHRNFWDGRANNIFNGRSAFGERDPNAFIWVAADDGSAVKKRLRLINSSLASQAMDPPIRSDTEMPCVGRKFEDLGTKLLHVRPLRVQRVHLEDSVLGPYASLSGRGLRTTYARLIRQAFNPKYWAGNGDFGTAPDGHRYSMLEANFSLFFGLAIQLYESTLVSDQAPYDLSRRAENVGIISAWAPADLNQQELRGLQLFNSSHCQFCHDGPTFSTAAVPEVRLVTTPGANPDNRTAGNVPSHINRLDTLTFGPTLHDVGYFNTGVIEPGNEDLGVGGADPFGNPLSLSAQYIEFLQGNEAKVFDPFNAQICFFERKFGGDFGRDQLIPDPMGVSGCKNEVIAKILAKAPSEEAAKAEYGKPGHGALRVAPSAFKVPTLRNVELTGPYFHNGSAATLREVIEFYNRNSNHDPAHKSPQMFELGLSDQDIDDLVAFLKSLTDPRVKWERAPFDHPEIFVPAGHVGDENFVEARLNGTAKDEWLRIPEVGKNGRTPEMGPVKTFEEVLCEANPDDPKCP